MSEVPKYRLDRTAFQQITVEEADAQMQYSKDLPDEERFNQFNYLMSIAYRFFGEEWPRMDKSIFEMRRRD